MEYTIAFRQELYKQANDWLLTFIELAEAMDISGIETLFDDDCIINDQSKWEFLSYIRDRFSNFRSLNVTRLNLKDEICLICNAGCPIHFFEAYEGNGLGFKIDYKNGILKDVTECKFSTGQMKIGEKLSWYSAHNYKPNLF